MTFTHKKFFTPTPDQQQKIRGAVQSVLYNATEVGAREIGSTGLSFVLIAVGEWSFDLAELDAGHAAEFLRATADIVESLEDPTKQASAQERRRKAIEALGQALDLMMAEVGGRA